MNILNETPAWLLAIAAIVMLFLISAIAYAIRAAYIAQKETDAIYRRVLEQAADGNEEG